MVIGIALGLVAACNWNADRKRVAQLRASLPVGLNSGAFLAFDRCDRFIGGISYVFALDREGMRQWRRSGSALLDSDDFSWRPVKDAEIVRKQDWPPVGLGCLASYKVPGGYLRDHLLRETTYYRQSGRSGDYVIPSLGLIVGGVEPH